VLPTTFVKTTAHAYNSQTDLQFVNVQMDMLEYSAKTSLIVTNTHAKIMAHVTQQPANASVLPGFQDPPVKQKHMIVQRKVAETVVFVIQPLDFVNVL
jgi:hypothetical protein